ncbi:hypothetical protein SynA1560_02439 [Synechococcus sp. A15-60]|nr:hypothetical protein SynA1560_02439 [Synechococcus sp. A15-60]
MIRLTPDCDLAHSSVFACTSNTVQVVFQALRSSIWRICFCRRQT